MVAYNGMVPTGIPFELGVKEHLRTGVITLA